MAFLIRHSTAALWFSVWVLAVTIVLVFNRNAHPDDLHDLALDAANEG